MSRQEYLEDTALGTRASEDGKESVTSRASYARFQLTVEDRLSPSIIGDGRKTDTMTAVDCQSPAYSAHNLGLENQSTTPNPFKPEIRVVYKLEVSHDRKNRLKRRLFPSGTDYRLAHRYLLRTKVR